MRLEEAKKIGEIILEALNPYIIKGSLAGSIRRQKSEVHDVDLVIKIKDDFLSKINIRKVLKKYGLFEKQGDKLITIKTEDNIQIDVYITTNLFEPLLLIRTGSKEHNLKLTMDAKRKGLTLTVGGLKNRTTGEVIAVSEIDIFDKLNMIYKEPEAR